MTKPKTDELSPLGMLVKKVEGGYQVHYTPDGAELTPLTDKVYFHPTSAYAAMGRMVHDANVKALGLEHDPSKAPKKADDKVEVKK